jgi:hypothetical protein
MAYQDDDDESFKALCLELLKAYLSLQESAEDLVEERGGGPPKDKQENKPDANHVGLMGQLSQHQPAQADNIVPDRLPEPLRNHPEDIKPQDIKGLYDIDTGVRQVEQGNLSALDLISLHLRSYRNILEIELGDLQLFRQRILHYLNEVFTETLDRCFNDRTSNNHMVSCLSCDLSCDLTH